MALAVKKRLGQALPAPRVLEPSPAAAAAGIAAAPRGGPPDAQAHVPRLIPLTAAAWQAAQELAQPRAPPQVSCALPQPSMPLQFRTPPRSPARTPVGGSPAPVGSANPSPVTSEGRVTLLPGYASRPQPSPVKPAPPLRLNGLEDGGFVRPASQVAGQEAHSAWCAGAQGVLGGGVGLGFGAQPAHEQGAHAGRFGAPTLPWARDQVAAGSRAGPGRWQAPVQLQASVSSGQPPASPAEGGGPEQAQAQVGGASALAGETDIGRRAPRPRKRRRCGAGGEAAPGGGLLLLGGLADILADQPTPQVSVVHNDCTACCEAH